jgi:hypothetical protein
MAAPHEPTPCDVLKTGTVQIIGYKAAKASHMKVYLKETGTTHDFSCGSYKEPVSLNQDIYANYYLDTCTREVNLVFDAYQYTRPRSNGNEEVNY